MDKLPQRLINVRVADSAAVMASPDLAAATAEANGGLAGRGRVLVRPSGTEPLVRVMVEAPTADEAEEVAARLVDLVERLSATV
jgi:phosphoglucosamine mutase